MQVDNNRFSLQSGLYIITIMGSLILDHSRKNDYNEFIKKHKEKGLQLL